MRFLKRPSFIVECFVTLLITLLYLSLGYDSAQQLAIKAPVFFCALFGVLLFIVQKKIPLFWSSPSLALFLGFGLFQITRTVVMTIFLRTEVPEGYSAELVKYAAKSSYFWAYCIGMFWLMSALYYRRDAVWRVLVVISCASFFLAMNVIPAVLINKVPAYILNPVTKETGFFYPLFYKLPGADYIFYKYALANSVSDITAIGFFSALALSFYTAFLVFDAFKNHRADENSARYFALMLTAVCAAVIAIAVLSMLSRGSILAWLVGVMSVTALFLIKYRSIKIFFLVIGFAILLGGIAGWGGSFDKVKRELETTTLEQKALKDDPKYAYHHGLSIYTWRAGIQTAKAIRADFSLWGVGTNGYGLVSEKYQKDEFWKRYHFAKMQATSHYFQIWADEGVGAFVYFLFLAVFFIEAFWKMLIMKSRFQFIVAACLTGAITMIFVHAVGIWTMQRLSTSMIVYALMGLTLGVLRSDFQHQTKATQVQEVNPE